MPEDNRDTAARMAREHNIPEIVARVLVQRGIASEDVAGFLNPTLRAHFPDPARLHGMHAFAKACAARIENGEIIGILGDFDVDGATSTAILVRYLRACGIDAPFVIPDRLKDGYGPNARAFETLKEAGANFVILADCGITATTPIEYAVNDLGLTVAVIDHHEPADGLPPAQHIVNPKLDMCESGYAMLAACGVVFLACVAVNAVLRERDFFKDREEPPLKNWLDLVALGTVCDMVPLTGPNRMFVRLGFQAMAAHNNPGLRALCETAKINGLPTPEHAGFQLGPRINAGSRVYRSDLGAKLLSTDDTDEALNIAWQLHDCNEERKSKQATMMKEAAVMASSYAQKGAIVLSAHGWHAGLCGLVAGRLKDQHKVPACVITLVELEDGTSEGRGSVRSVKGVNVAALLQEAAAEGLLIKGGGHAMAGGLTIAPDKISVFRDWFSAQAATAMAAFDPTPECVVDGMVSLGGIRPEFVKILNDHVGPYGQGHAEPVFVIPDVTLLQVDTVGTGHVRCTVTETSGGGRMKCIAFGAEGTPMGDALLRGRGQRFHLQGCLKLNEWNGYVSAEMHITDAARAEAVVTTGREEAAIL